MFHSTNAKMPTPFTAWPLDRTNLHDLGSDYVAYKEGTHSMDLIKRNLGAGFNDNEALTWVEKLCLAANACLNEHSEELDVDGYFLVSRSGGTPQAAAPPSLLWSKMGPSLFFVMRTRSAKDYARWREASLLEKLRIGNLHETYLSFSKYQPVLPIWTTSPYAVPKISAFSDILNDTEDSWQSMTPFPTTKSLKDMKVPDPTTDPVSQTVRGPICDIAEGRVVLASAEEYRSHCLNNSETGVLRLQPVAKRKVTQSGLWIQRNELRPEDDDQIKAFIRGIADLEKSPEDLISYRHARSWASTACFHEVINLAKSMVPSVEDERALRWPSQPTTQDVLFNVETQQTDEVNGGDDDYCGSEAHMQSL